MNNPATKYGALSLDDLAEVERALKMAGKYASPTFPFDDALKWTLVNISKKPELPFYDLDIRLILSKYCDLAFDGFQGVKRQRHEGSTANRKRREDLARSRGTHTEEEWDLLVEYCSWKCVRCNVSILERQLTKDHVIPLVFEGLATDHLTNLQPLCLKCNSWKACKPIDFVPFKIRERVFWEYGFLWFDEKGHCSLQVSKEEYAYHCRHEGPYRNRKHWEVVYH